jgi:hypothetical protein
LEPLQSGLAKRGPEAFCHSLRALREKGYAIFKTDFANGFNALSRPSMLDAVQLRCPQLTFLFNFFYTVDGACFYAVGEVVELIWSAEGARGLSAWLFRLRPCAARTAAALRGQDRAYRGALSYGRLQPGPVATLRPQ